MYAVYNPAINCDEITKVHLKSKGWFMEAYKHPMKYFTTSTVFVFSLQHYNVVAVYSFNLGLQLCKPCISLHVIFDQKLLCTLFCFKNLPFRAYNSECLNDLLLNLYRGCFWILLPSMEIICSYPLACTLKCSFYMTSMGQ